MKTLNRKSGFTLIEIIVVLIIIGVLPKARNRMTITTKKTMMIIHVNF